MTLGSLYPVVAGDSLTALAGLFSTTVKSILHLNPRLNASDALLTIGSHLCVAACTAQPNPTFDARHPA